MFLLSLQLSFIWVLLIDLIYQLGFGSILIDFRLTDSQETSAKPTLQ